jgi:hypothetical protein
LVQEALEFNPDEVENVPPISLQGVGETAPSWGQKKPGGQVKQVEYVDAAGYWEKVPIGQGIPVKEVRDWLQNVPAMHGLHIAEPGAGLK